MCLCLSGYPFLCLPVCQSVHHTCICSVTFAIKLNSRILFSKICQQIVVLFPTVVFIFSFSCQCKILSCSPNFSSQSLCFLKGFCLRQIKGSVILSKYMMKLQSQISGSNLLMNFLVIFPIIYDAVLWCIKPLHTHFLITKSVFLVGLCLL